MESIPSSRIRKIENYFLRTIQHELYVTHDPDIPREELEKYILEREREREKLEQSCLAERVIGSRWNEDGETEYFVKCKQCSRLRRPSSLIISQGVKLVTTVAPGSMSTFSNPSPKLRLKHISNTLRSPPPTISPGQTFQTSDIGRLAVRPTI